MAMGGRLINENTHLSGDEERPLSIAASRFGSGTCFQFPLPEGFSLSDGGAGALMPAPLATSFSLLWRCT